MNVDSNFLREVPLFHFIHYSLDTRALYDFELFIMYAANKTDYFVQIISILRMFNMSIVCIIQQRSTPSLHIYNFESCPL